MVSVAHPYLDTEVCTIFCWMRSEHTGSDICCTELLSVGGAPILLDEACWRFRVPCHLLNCSDEQFRLGFLLLELEP